LQDQTVHYNNFVLKYKTGHANIVAGKWFSKDK